jgi:DNA (cytosine-5)-methyltransferase 1
MNVLDLFSGIGGFSLGLERAGMRTVAFCECDPFCQRVLRKHWPDVPIYDDVRTLTAARLMADADERRRESKRQQEYSKQQSALRHQSDGCDQGRSGPWPIDLIAGGFPCQDISVAGKGAGLAGERSGLWSEYARIIGEVRPRYVIVENVAVLLGRGLERVLGDLAALGFDAEWHCIPASAVGAPHRRDRVWIVAYAQHGREFNGAWPTRRPTGEWQAERSEPRRDWWLTEPDVGRVAHGVPARVDRLRALGNAVVPQITEIIGRAIMSIERDGYDGDDDLSKSIDECYRAIRARKAKGGKGWGE